MTNKRKDAMLTKTDRAFLGTSEEYYTGENAKQQRYERREALRERIESSLDDFRLLFEKLPENQRQKIFGDYTGPNRKEFADDETRERVIWALAFLLRETGVTDCMGQSGLPTNPLFKQTVLEALRRVGEEEGYLVRGFDHGSIDAERMPSRELKRKLERGEDLSSEELRYLIEQEGMKNEVQEQIRSRVLDG